MQVKTKAINRRIRENEGGLLLQVKVEGVRDTPSGPLMRDVNSAVDVANAELVVDGLERVAAQPPVTSIRGPIIDLDWVGSDHENARWLNAFAAALTARGYTGFVAPAPEANLPKGAEEGAGIWPAAQLIFTPEYPDHLGYPPATWLAPEATTAAFADHAAAWIELGAATTYLSEGIVQVAIDCEGAARTFAGAIERSAQASLIGLDGPPFEIRAAQAFSFGLAAYSAGREGAHWSDFTAMIREPLIAHAPLLDIGFVRPRPVLSPCVFADWAVPDLPFATESEWRYNRQFYSRFVPDAHGIQLLAKSHLDKANDLSGWLTRSLGNDRYLVEARDLEPWFTGIGPVGLRPYPRPDPEVLAAARRDFGAMILTHEVLEADPNAWIRGRLFHPVTREKPTRNRRR